MMDDPYHKEDKLDLMLPRNQEASRNTNTNINGPKKLTEKSVSFKSHASYAFAPPSIVNH